MFSNAPNASGRAGGDRVEDSDPPLELEELVTVAVPVAGLKDSPQVFGLAAAAFAVNCSATASAAYAWSLRDSEP